MFSYICLKSLSCTSCLHYLFIDIGKVMKHNEQNENVGHSMANLTGSIGNSRQKYTLGGKYGVGNSCTIMHNPTLNTN